MAVPHCLREEVLFPVENEWGILIVGPIKARKVYLTLLVNTQKDGWNFMFGETVDNVSVLIAKQFLQIPCSTPVQEIIPQIGAWLNQLINLAEPALIAEMLKTLQPVVEQMVKSFE